MSETYNLSIDSERYGHGFVCFFDEPFGEQAPFEWAGGFSVDFDCGVRHGGQILQEDQARGVDAWLAKHGWIRAKDDLRTK